MKSSHSYLEKNDMLPAPLRIAFDSQIFRSQRHGGISRYFVSLAGELASMGENVRIFASHHGNEYLDTLDSSISPQSILVPAINSLPRRPYRLRLLLTQMEERMRIRKWKPQVLHETYFEKRTVAPKRCPVVLTVYDMIYELFPDQFKPSDVTRKSTRHAVARADHIICISESTRTDLLSLLSVDPKKVSVILPGFAGFEPLGSQIENPRTSPKPYLLFVGQRRGYKNFDNLLRAYATAESLKNNFDLIAFGGGAFTPEEVSLMISLGLAAANVRQESGGDRQLALRYRGASAFVYPSIYEGFGMPPLEAMAQGCPAISSNTSSLPEVLGDAAEFFDPLNTESIAHSLLKVLESPSYSTELVRRGAIRSRQFSWHNCAIETRQVYRALCG